MACAESSKEALSLGAAGSIPALCYTLSGTGKMLAEGYRWGGGVGEAESPWSAPSFLDEPLLYLLSQMMGCETGVLWPQ